MKYCRGVFSKDGESQNSLDLVVPQKFTWANCSCKREPWWDCLAPCWVLKTTTNENSTTSLGKLFQWLTTVTAKKFLSYINLSQCNLFMLALVFSSWKDLYHLPCSCPFSSGTLWWGLHHTFSRETPSLFPHKASSPALWSPLWPSFRTLLGLQEQELDTSLQMWPYQHWVEWSHLPFS